MDPLHGSSRSRTLSKVSFTIGDSSDNDSVSTTTSSSVVNDSSRRKCANVLNPSEECEEESIEVGFCQDNPNPWHKYHFHHETVIANGSMQNGVNVKPEFERGTEKCKRKKEGTSESVGNNEEVSPSTLETTRMTPEGELSIAQLDHVEVEDETKVSDLSNANRNWGKWRILVGCAIAQFFSALTVSLQAPFYPAEAEKKGASATEYCFVFSVFELTAFIVQPFFGSKIHKWKPKLVFNIGIFTTAIASIIFGILDKINNRQYFIASCALARTIEALGESASVTASFIIVASAFSDSIGPTFAVLETFYSAGLISGPIIGTLAYQMGGFPLPFLFVGGALLLVAALNFIVLPSSEEISLFQSKQSIIISSYRSFKLLAFSSVLISAICITIGAMSLSYIQATLEPHLRQFNISQLSTGAIFTINGAIFTIITPFLGLLCDKIVQLKLLTFCGNAILFGGFALIGPFPVFQFEPKLWIICLGLALQGLGLGMILVSSFVSIHRSIISVKGLPDTPSTYALVSSLWSSMFSFGCFMGAILSGVLYDAVGFSWGTGSILGLSSFMMLVLLFFICASDKEMDSFVEGEPLLNLSTAPSTSTYLSADSEPCTSSTAITRWNNRKNQRNSYESI